MQNAQHFGLAKLWSCTKTYPGPLKYCHFSNLKWKVCVLSQLTASKKFQNIYKMHIVFDVPDILHNIWSDQDKKLPVTLFCGHMDVNSYTYKYKPVEMCFMTWNKQQTNTRVTHIYIHFHGITDNIYDFEDLFFSWFFYSSTTRHPSSDISTHPQRLLPVHLMGGRVSA